MSILVACNCGKRFKAGEQFAGKRTRCPGCGQTLTIPGGSPKKTTAAPAAPAPPPQRATARPPAVAAARSAARPAPPPPAEDDLATLGVADEVFQPAPRSESAPTTVTKAKKASGLAAAAAAAGPPLSKRNRPTAGADGPRFSMSPGMIVLIVLAILIPSTITWVKLGPMKAHEQWVQISSVAEDNIQGQIQRALLEERKKYGGDVNEIKFMPKVTNFQFDGSKDVFMIRLPDNVAFQGRTTEGNFYGTFHPKTYRFELDMDINDTKHKLAGSASESDQSLDMDGTPIK